MSPSPTRLRRIFGRLLLAAVSFAAAFGVAELALRVAGWGNNADQDSLATDSLWLTVENSAELGWIFPADTTGTYQSSGRHTPVTTNAWGLRGPAVSDAPIRRILVLGDSYTFGWGVDDAAGFVRLLEAELNRELSEQPAVFINGGVPGYSIYQQNLMLDYVRRRTDIHAVVATISLANDPIDEKRIRRYAPDRLSAFSYEWRDPDSFTSRVIAGSRLLTLLDQHTTHWQFSLINSKDECRDLAEESLRQQAAACRQARLPLVWVIVPRMPEIRPGGFLTRSFNGASDRMRRHFLELAAELDVPVIDLKPILAEVQTREEVYLPGDAHWNEAGHRAVAEAILPVLRHLPE